MPQCLKVFFIQFVRGSTDGFRSEAIRRLRLQVAVNPLRMANSHCSLASMGSTFVALTADGDAANSEKHSQIHTDLPGSDISPVMSMQVLRTVLRTLLGTEDGFRREVRARSRRCWEGQVVGVLKNS